MSHIRQAVTIMINIQSTLCTAPDLCKTISLAVLFRSKGNSRTIYMQSDMCIYTHVLHNIETLVGQRNKIKLGQQRTPRAIGSSALIYYLLLCLSISPALLVVEPSIPRFSYESSY